MNRCIKCGYTGPEAMCPRCGSYMRQGAGHVPTADDMMRGGPGGYRPYKRKPFLFQNGCFTAILLIIFWPIGLIMMWVNGNYNRTVRIIITVICALMVAAALLSGIADEGGIEI